MRACLLCLTACLVAACAVSQSSAPEPRRGLVSFAVEGASLRSVAFRIARASGRRILVAPGVDGRVSLALRDVPWRAALDRVAAQAGCRVDEAAEGVLLLAEEDPRVSLWGDDVRVRPLLGLLATYGGRTISFEPEVRGRAGASFEDTLWSEAMASVAADVSAAVIEAGSTHLHALPKSRLSKSGAARLVPLRFLSSEAHALRVLTGEAGAAWAWSGASGSLPLVEELRAVAPLAYVGYDPASNALVIRGEAEELAWLLRRIEEADRLPAPLRAASVFLDDGGGCRINGRVCEPGDSVVDELGAAIPELVLLGVGDGRAVFLYRDRRFVKALSGG